MIIESFLDFTEFTPVTTAQQQLAERGVKFINDVTGRCWYDIVSQYKSDTNYYVSIDSEGYVTCLTTDISSLFPINCSVVVTDTVPSAMLTSSAGWKYEGGTFNRDVATSAELTAKKERLMTSVSQEIQTLLDAVEFDMASDEDKERLLALRKYRVELQSVDVSLGNDVVFPAKP